MEVSVTSKQQLHALKNFSILLKSVFLCPQNTPSMIWGVNFDNQEHYFLSKKECKTFIKNNNISKNDMFTLEYMVDHAGRSETIRYISGNTIILYNAVNPNLYETFDFEKSLKRGYPCWNMHCGTIKDKYDILEEHGIVFEQNIYKDKSFKKVLTNNN